MSMVYDYSPLQWLLIFYSYCFLGWCFESTVVSVRQRRPVNRGFLRGPALPIYGFGATLLLYVSLPLYEHPAALFFASMAAATVFEYIVGVIMEKIFKVKYWDYSEHHFQFQGRICLQSSLCWGFLGLILARVLHPPVEWVAVMLPFWALLALDVLLSAVFAADVAVSVRAALDLARLLEELDRLREQGDQLRQELSETAMVQLTRLSYRMDEARGDLAEKMDEAREQLADQVDEAREQLAFRMDEARELTKKMNEAREQLADQVDEAREQLAAHMGEARGQLQEQIGDTRAELQERLDALQRSFEERAASLKKSRRHMLRGNPSARSARYDEVLQKLKKHLEQEKTR